MKNTTAFLLLIIAAQAVIIQRSCDHPLSKRIYWEEELEDLERISTQLEFDSAVLAHSIKAKEYTDALNASLDKSGLKEADKILKFKATEFGIKQKQE